MCSIICHGVAFCSTLGPKRLCSRVQTATRFALNTGLFTLEKYVWPTRDPLLCPVRTLVKKLRCPNLSSIRRSGSRIADPEGPRMPTDESLSETRRKESKAATGRASGVLSARSTRSTAQRASAVIEGGDVMPARDREIYILLHTSQHLHHSLRAHLVCSCSSAAHGALFSTVLCSQCIAHSALHTHARTRTHAHTHTHTHTHMHAHTHTDA